MRRAALYATFLGSTSASLALSLLLFTGPHATALTLVLYGYAAVALIAGIAGYRARMLEAELGRHPSLREIARDLAALFRRAVRDRFKRSERSDGYGPDPAPDSPGRGAAGGGLHVRRRGTGHAG